jgi:hypothetical protein
MTCRRLNCHYLKIARKVRHSMVACRPVHNGRQFPLGRPLPRLPWQMDQARDSGEEKSETAFVAATPMCRDRHGRPGTYRVLYARRVVMRCRPPSHTKRNNMTWDVMKRFLFPASHAMGAGLTRLPGLPMLVAQAAGRECAAVHARSAGGGPAARRLKGPASRSVS